MAYGETLASKVICKKLPDGFHVFAECTIECTLEGVAKTKERAIEKFKIDCQNLIIDIQEAMSSI